MSVPRLVLASLEPGPALALAAGALQARLSQERAVRVVTVGADLPLWRLLLRGAAASPRALDPVLHDAPTAAELVDVWSDGIDLLLVVAVAPALDRWHGVTGSRAVDVAAVLDAPLVLALDARERGATVAAGVCGLRALMPHLDLAGAVVVGALERGEAAEAGALLREQAGIPVLGWVPPQLSDQFARDHGPAGARQVGPRPPADAAARLAAEAGRYLDGEQLLAAAARAGFLPPAGRRAFVPAAAARGVTVAVGVGGPLLPFALEAVDLLRALGATVVPLRLDGDEALPAGTDAVFLSGLLDEARLPGLSPGLAAALAEAVGRGLPVLACGAGSLLLAERLSDSRGRVHEGAGALPWHAAVAGQRPRPTYVTATATAANPFAQGGVAAAAFLEVETVAVAGEGAAWRLGGEGEAPATDGGEGVVVGRCLATTLLPSLATRPDVLQAFLAAARAGA